MDHLADIKKYASTVDENVVANMERTYRLVLSRPDSARVSEGDTGELKVVRENFVKKIPGRNSRLTVYYLLAEHYGKLDMFR